MSLRPESPLKQVPLWQWGALMIIAGLLTNAVGSVMQPSSGLTTAAERGAAFGRGLATLLIVIAGVVMIIMHFVRRKPKSKVKKSKGRKKVRSNPTSDTP